MSNLKIAVAQVPSIKGDVDENIKTHLVAIEKASQLGVSYIAFPELSITGYEPELAAKLAFSTDDIRLKPLIDSAIENKIKIGVGAPLKSDGLPKIGLIIISEIGYGFNNVYQIGIAEFYKALMYAESTIHILLLE